MGVDLARSPAYITGAVETDIGKVSGQSQLSMFAGAARQAAIESGITLRDVDGVFVPFMGFASAVYVAEYLGIQPRIAESSDHGGGQFEAMVSHAVAAIAAGLCEVALVGFASRQRSLRSRSRNLADATTGESVTDQFETPYALPIPIGHFALAAARHMYQYGTTPEQLAEVAVTARRWAQRNPAAWVRDPLTVEDVLASPLLCDPIRKLDMCLVTDGGGAVIVTTAERARDASTPLVRVLGMGESMTHYHIWSAEDITTWPGSRSGPQAFGMAGIKHNDVDVFEPYDAATIAVLIALEDLGFCAKGESGDLVQSGALAPGGALPSMTNGGGLSYAHPGAYGMQLLIEAVRQLRGECGERQVPDARIAVAHGIGGMFWMCSTLVLARE